MDLIIVMYMLCILGFGAAVGVTVERIRVRRWLKKLAPETLELLGKNKII